MINNFNSSDNQIEKPDTNNYSDKYFKLPNKYIKNNTVELEIISQLCKRKSIDGFWEGHINGLLYYSNIPLDRNYRNKKHTMQFLRSIGANIQGDYISILVDALFDTNENNVHIKYTKVNCDVYNLIDDLSLFKYYIYMLYSIGYSKGCYKNSLLNIGDDIGFSTPSIIRYNKTLMDLGLIYYVNSGDLHSKINNLSISSINFYGLSILACQLELDNWLQINKENFGIVVNNTDKKYSSTDLRSASMIIYHHAKKDNLSHDNYDRLINAYDIILSNIKFDYTDMEVKESKILTLIKKTKGGNYELTYEMAKNILDGKLTIGECFNGGNYE